MVKRSQFGTAKVKERDAGRPLLVLLLIAAAGLLVFLWMQDDSVDPVVTAEVETTTEESTDSVQTDAAEQMPSVDSGLADWWYEVETSISDAFAAAEYAEEGECEDLEFAVDDLKGMANRPEPPISSAFSNLIGSLDRAVGACRSNNAATVRGSATSARSHLQALKSAASGYGLPPAQMLESL